ncbi:MAG: D-alanyl-D-alanine carboxypeptidase/D-alanyl-D-alanine-endopeptidase [Rhodoferax sp.]|nr:D-alanyl-D-alanine carboxypeptidase/D-alanyl-D-alanine-endopeptidase [Rhodoferax sp.]
MPAMSDAPPRWNTAAAVCARCLAVTGLLLTAWLPAAPACAQALPVAVEAALQRAGLPRDALAVLLVDAEGRTPPRVSHRAGVPMNPASTMKLVTTYAALDLLGPAWVWRTPVYIEGAVRDGVLYGHLYLRGQGDPKLVTERVWLLMRRLRGLGIQRIAGDIVLDRSAFELPDIPAGRFDGEALRPYNATPDALLVNYKALQLTLVPDRLTQTAQLHVEPPLARLQVPRQLPLQDGPCADWRAALKADFTDPAQLRLAGAYPAACGERSWALAPPDPAGFAARVIEGLWREAGGQLDGAVREGRVPATLEPVLTLESPALAEVVRDINKYSNNVMAQQLFLTLALARPAAGAAAPTAVAPSSPATPERARAALRQWWQERLPGVEAPLLDNGSGLSREERISAQAMARLLQTAYRSPLMPELMASLPVPGADGTLRNRAAPQQGGAHLKTGSLRDVTALAGYLHTANGRRLVLVALVNHPQAAAARPALDALVDWALHDNGGPPSAPASR